MKLSLSLVERTSYFSSLLVLYFPCIYVNNLKSINYIRDSFSLSLHNKWKTGNNLQNFSRTFFSSYLKLYFTFIYDSRIQRDRIQFFFVFVITRTLPRVHLAIFLMYPLPRTIISSPRCIDIVDVPI